MSDVTAYKKTAITGGGATALDGIDGAGLLDGDFAFVMASGVGYTYILDDDSGAAESSPDIIAPDTNPGNKRWILQPHRATTATNKGIVELATDAETQTGTDTERAITPANLTARTATETRTGVAELATVAEAVAGTDTSRIVTAAGNAASEAVVKNPLQPAQGVHMTYAASGSSGITVADNVNINNPLNNYSLSFKGSIPVWNPAATQVIFGKYQDPTTYILVDVEQTTGYLKYRHVVTGATTVNCVTTVAPNFTDGTSHEIDIVITRETASVDGSAKFYVDGELFESVEISDGTPANLTMTGSWQTLGWQDARYEGICNSFIMFNRALTAAEVLSLYRNGVDWSDKWGSQTSIITGNDSTFAGASNWANVDMGTFDSAGDLSIAWTAAQYCKLNGGVSHTAGKKYRLVVDVGTLTTANGAYLSLQSLLGSTEWMRITDADSGTTKTTEFTADVTGTAMAVIGSYTGSVDLDNFLLYEIGATLCLEPEGIQPAPGQWLDSSTNKLHAMQPASGSSLIRTQKEFEFRWTNVWTASSAAQYIGGLNQAVLSADHFITSITTQATVTTDVENLELGDGSAVAKFVAAFAPSATRTSQTIAAQNDGTNLKLVYTPAAEATMTVETIIRGFIWEP